MKHTLEEKCRQLISERKYEACFKEIGEAMTESPHEAIPHNLMGILMEKQRDHVLAMKHFRAAYALDPTYVPARYNMELCGQCCTTADMAFVEEDCPVKNNPKFKVVYDERNVGRMVRV